MDNPDDVRTEAERVFRQRALDRLSAAITDPAMKTMTQQFASGQLSPRDVIRHLEHSHAAMRGFDSYIARLMRLSPQQREAMRAEHERRVAEIADELSAARHVTPAPRRAHRPRHAEDEEEAPWEDGSWLR